MESSPCKALKLSVNSSFSIHSYFLFWAASRQTILYWMIPHILATNFTSCYSLDSIDVSTLLLPCRNEGKLFKCILSGPSSLQNVTAETHHWQQQQQNQQEGENENLCTHRITLLSYFVDILSSKSSESSEDEIMFSSFKHPLGKTETNIGIARKKGNRNPWLQVHIF